MIPNDFVNIFLQGVQAGKPVIAQNTGSSVWDRKMRLKDFLCLGLHPLLSLLTILTALHAKRVG